MNFDEPVAVFSNKNEATIYVNFKVAGINLMGGWIATIPYNPELPMAVVKRS